MNHPHYRNVFMGSEKNTAINYAYLAI